MRVPKKNILGRRDDSLYGLLSSYKSNYTYIKVFVSEEDHSIVLLLADNPKRFFDMPVEKFRNYRMLSRLEMGIAKISIKYLSPENLIVVLGPLLGFTIPTEKSVMIDSLKKDGYYSMETSLRYKTRMLQGVKKLINMSPHKRYEILEKYFSADQEYSDGRTE